MFTANSPITIARSAIDAAATNSGLALPILSYPLTPIDRLQQLSIDLQQICKEIKPHYHIADVVNIYLTDLNLNYPNNLIKMAMSSYFASVFTLDDLTQIYGSYQAKHSTHIKVTTLGYLQNKILYQKSTFISGYINTNGKTIDRSDLLPNDLRDHQQFIDKFTNYLINYDQDDDTDDQLKLYFTIKSFIDQNDINDKIPFMENNFDYLKQYY